MERLHHLTPDQRPRWGRMDAGRMLAHLTDACKMATGDLAVAPRNGPLRYWPLRDLVIYYLPWPKGAPTAPELIRRSVDDWEHGLHEFDRAADRVVQKATVGPLAEHPAFGRLNRQTWGVLIARHIDHHLKQFGL